MISLLHEPTQRSATPFCHGLWKAVRFGLVPKLLIASVTSLEKMPLCPENRSRCRSDPRVTRESRPSALRRLSVVEVEEPSEPRSTFEIATDTVTHFVTHTIACFAGQRVIVSERRPDELAADSLVEPLFVIVSHVLPDHVSKMPITEEDEVPQALEFN